jgi:hypothetical protein
MQWLVLIHGLTAVISIFFGHFPVQKKQSVGFEAIGRRFEAIGKAERLFGPLPDHWRIIAVLTGILLVILSI